MKSKSMRRDDQNRNRNRKQNKRKMSDHFNRNQQRQEEGKEEAMYQVTLLRWDEPFSWFTPAIFASITFNLSLISSIYLEGEPECSTVLIADAHSASHAQLSSPRSPKQFWVKTTKFSSSMVTIATDIRKSMSNWNPRRQRFLESFSL